MTPFMSNLTALAFRNRAARGVDERQRAGGTTPTVADIEAGIEAGPVVAGIDNDGCFGRGPWRSALPALERAFNGLFTGLADRGFGARAPRIIEPSTAPPAQTSHE